MLIREKSYMAVAILFSYKRKQETIKNNRIAKIRETKIITNKAVAAFRSKILCTQLVATIKDNRIMTFPKKHIPCYSSNFL